MQFAVSQRVVGDKSNFIEIRKPSCLVSFENRFYSKKLDLKKINKK